MKVIRWCIKVAALCSIAIPTVSLALSPHPVVGVFAQQGFPYYMESPLLNPAEIASDLNHLGIQTRKLDVKALCNPAVLNVRNVAILILPYGNTFPVAAMPNLIRYHREGGCLVTTGVPFTHTVVRDNNGSWNDTGNVNGLNGFADNAIGVGGFSSGSADPVAIAAGDPLGLAPLKRTWNDSGQLQTIDVPNLPTSDTVIPLLNEGPLPVAALIKHVGDGFQPAMDVWTHHGDSGDYEAWDSRQLCDRAALFILHEQGHIGDHQLLHDYHVLNTIRRPKVYKNVKLPVIPRPYATFQPTFNKPAAHLYEVNMKGLPDSETIMLITLQGLVNRNQPRIFLNFTPDDAFWLAEMQRQGSTSTPIHVANPLQLFKKFRSSFKGAVVADPHVYVTPDIAMDAAAAYDLVVATPQLAHRLHIPITMDLRGKFKDDAAALKYMRIKIMPHLNKYLSICIDPTILNSGAEDEIIAARGITWWVTGPKAAFRPGANEAEELKQIKAMLADLPLDSVVHGFYWHGGGVGLDEGPGVSLASQFGKVTTVSDYVSNFSVYGGVHIPKLTQHFEPAPTYDPHKVYLAITISDGDNLCTWRGFFRNYFKNPLHGEFPIGWGMGPTLIDCAPTWAKWYYDHELPTDEFICDVSGVGYIYPPDWATALDDRSAAFQAFYGWTQKYMDRMDMHTVRLMGVDAASIAEVGHYMPATKFFMADYGFQGETSYPQITYRLPSGQDVFRAATGGGTGEHLASVIKARIGDARPAFVNVFCMNWSTTLEGLQQMLKLLGPDYVPVTPTQLDTLYQESQSTH